MALSAAHWLARAEEARVAARLCDDPALSTMMDEIAREYEALAACRERTSRGPAAASRHAAPEPSALLAVGK
jgi:hypothetical protein